LSVVYRDKRITRNRSGDRNSLKPQVERSSCTPMWALRQVSMRLRRRRVDRRHDIYCSYISRCRGATISPWRLPCLRLSVVWIDYFHPTSAMPVSVSALRC